MKETRFLCYNKRNRVSVVFHMNTKKQLPIPPHFDAKKVGEVWRVSYQEIANTAKNWAIQYDIPPVSPSQKRIGLLLIDVQNTFCLPGFELFVGGQSGRGAIDDNVRLCQFIYRNLAQITDIIVTMDTHNAMQIFHPIFWVNQAGEHPTPAATIITLEDVQNGIWRVNPAVAASLSKGDYEKLQKHALHYVKTLSNEGKYPLTIWPYHSMLGGIGHALVSAIEEAVFFHNICRQNQTIFEMKGRHPLTENYSVLRPEVLDNADGSPLGDKNYPLIEKLLGFDKIIIVGQAKSHCVAWTIEDLLTVIKTIDANLAKKVYLLDDCTSAVVVPGVIDFTEQADATYARFADAGMHLVKSSQNLANWPNFS